MNKLIIAAPFGNYLHFQNTTRTLGTFTAQRRGGWIHRLLRILKTVRYNSDGWVNRLGLPNPGIQSLQKPIPDAILSVHGFNKEEWKVLLAAAVGFEAVELNLSCPNVGRVILDEVLEPLKDFPGRVIAKLSPVNTLEMGKPLHEAGVRTFHLCNTLPTKAGGQSGKGLMKYSLKAVEEFRKTFGDDVVLIGGGGVTEVRDALTYMRAGADHVSVASMLFNPFAWYKVRGMVETLQGK